MPNRIIKESLCTSEKISSLSDFEFRLWVSLLVLVDDAGRGDARPAIIKGRAFPLRERIAVKEIENALHGLAAKGCVSLYEVGGKPYFSFPTWGRHQRLDRAKPKYPGPAERDTSAADCGDLPQIAADCGDLPPESQKKKNNIYVEQPEAVSTQKKFIKPSLEEVAAYCKERRNSVDPQRFIDFYTSNGWKVGKNPMKDWKAAVRTWERNNPVSSAPVPDYDPDARYKRI